MLYCWNGLVMLKENTELRSKHLQFFNDEAEKLEGKNQAAAAGRAARNLILGQCLHRV